MRGGGIHAKGSTVAVHQQETLQFVNNRAENGSGFYIHKLYLNNRPLLVFRDNHANYGGAIYVADNTNSGACSPNIECFIQTLALYQYSTIHTLNILSSHNTANEQGANLFGGLLDRCIPSPFAEVYLKQRTYYSDVSYFGNISNLRDLDTISSLLVRVCFCRNIPNENEPDCSYQPPTIIVKKGEAFTVPLVAVDQVNHSVNANIISSLSSQDGVFSEGQQSQSVGRNCSNITFNIFSPHNSETMNLYADGPCGSSTLSVRHLDIQLVTQGVNAFVTHNCLPLLPIMTATQQLRASLTRVNTNSWIDYINDTDPPGYVIHPNCPLDYCQLPTKNISMNFNLPNGADAQCAYNCSHCGVLCGSCQEHLSLSLGSSHCLFRHSHWPVVLVITLLAAIIAGILLVTALLRSSQYDSGCWTDQWLYLLCQHCSNK